KRVVLAGGSGFIGRSLSACLAAKGYEVVVLSRQPARLPKGVVGVVGVAWDGRTPGEWTACVDGACAVVNLAGKNVNCRYTTKNLREIDESRVESVAAVNQAIAGCKRPPKVLIQASTLAIYGDAGERVCDETAPLGAGIPVATASAWEAAFHAHPTPCTKRVLLRISFVLGRDGGALATMARLARWFLGGTIGSGRQYISWIHPIDLNQMFLWAIERDDVEGLYNATSPQAVTNAEFMRQLRRAVGRTWSPPAPAWAVRLGCFLMRTEPVLALTGRRGIPRRFLEQGFPFAHQAVGPGIDDVLAGS
ncbi:MAG TPA: TIGR01777 family oxidoreductase, partial [Pirellulales bacterium]|nr:TIGR01777 family oxidoreductase [Pirellulales bacterium]